MLENCPVEIYQNDYEFSQLYDAVKSINPTRIVEIGSLFGGTLWYWMQMCQPKSQFLVVDKMIAQEDDRYARQFHGHNRLWYEWANAKQHNLQVIDNYSQEPNVIEAVYHNMKPVDLLFIDGDHGYNGVKSDFLIYLDCVRPGGIIAFHDTYNTQWNGVNQFWMEVKQYYKHQDFVQIGANMGIGIIYVPERP